MNHRESLVHLLKSQCLQTPQFVAEVGVHRGRTSKLLLTEFPRLHLYMVDLWAPAQEQTSDPITKLDAEQQEVYYLESLDQVKHFPTRAEVLRMDSVAAVALMQPLDAGFIDADHSEPGCRRDIRAYWDAVKPQGILCGHDYDKDDLPGVTLAVDEFVRDKGLELHTADGNLWWVRRS